MNKKVTKATDGPPPDWVKLAPIRVSKKMVKSIRDAAREDGRSQASWLRRAIAEKIRRQEKARASA